MTPLTMGDDTVCFCIGAGELNATIVEIAKNTYNAAELSVADSIYERKDSIELSLMGFLQSNAYLLISFGLFAAGQGIGWLVRRHPALPAAVGIGEAEAVAIQQAGEAAIVEQVRGGGAPPPPPTLWQSAIKMVGLRYIMRVLGYGEENVEPVENVEDVVDGGGVEEVVGDEVIEVPAPAPGTPSLARRVVVFTAERAAIVRENADTVRQNLMQRFNEQ